MNISLSLQDRLLKPRIPPYSLNLTVSSLDSEEHNVPSAPTNNSPVDIAEEETLRSDIALEEILKQNDQTNEKVNTMCNVSNK